MSITVFAEIQDGKIKKSSLEAVAYAKQMNAGQVTAVAIGAADAAAIAQLGTFGADQIKHAEVNSTDSGVLASALAEAAAGSSWIIVSNTYTGKLVAPRVAVKLKAGVVSGVISLPEGGKVKKSCFSGKGFAWVALNQSVNVIAITPNSFNMAEQPAPGNISSFQPAATASGTQSIEVKRVTGKIPLTEAEVVVSGGRGWKGPENWGMIEELAELLGAATACSKPVSDMDWRPHEEHVGQTGITIKPNLYIATGISGAIQHLAGVSSSKVIVAINKDAEAPFFKVADYGIVGDVFEVMPKIIEAAKNLKSQQN